MPNLFLYPNEVCHIVFGQEKTADLVEIHNFRNNLQTADFRVISKIKMIDKIIMP